MEKYPLTFNEFKDGLREGKLLGLKCRDCSDITAPPNGVCASCGGPNLDIIEAQKQGVVRTFTVIRVSPEGFNPPYIVAMVELDDGPWILGNIADVDPDEVNMDIIGRRVSVDHVFYPPPDLEDGIEGAAFIFKPI